MLSDIIKQTVNSIITLIFKYTGYDVAVREKSEESGVYSMIVEPILTNNNAQIGWNATVIINAIEFADFPAMRTIYEEYNKRDIVSQMETFIETHYAKPVTIAGTFTLKFDSNTYPSAINLIDKLASIFVLHKEDIIILAKLKMLNFRIINTSNVSGWLYANPSIQVMVSFMKDYLVFSSTDYRNLGIIGDIKIENK